MKSYIGLYLFYNDDYRMRRSSTNELVTSQPQRPQPAWRITGLLPGTSSWKTRGRDSAEDQLWSNTRPYAHTYTGLWILQKFNITRKFPENFLITLLTMPGDVIQSMTGKYSSLHYCITSSSASKEVLLPLIERICLPLLLFGLKVL